MFVVALRISYVLSRWSRSFKLVQCKQIFFESAFGIYTYVYEHVIIGDAPVRCFANWRHLDANMALLHAETSHKTVKRRIGAHLHP